MNVSSVSDFSNYLTSQASGMQSSRVTQSIETAVFKKIMDQQEQAAGSLIQMIQNTPGSPVSNGHVDIRV